MVNYELRKNLSTFSDISIAIAIGTNISNVNTKEPKYFFNMYKSRILKFTSDYSFD